MAAEEADKLIVYTFVDGNERFSHLDDSEYHHNIDISGLFKLKVSIRIQSCQKTKKVPMSCIFATNNKFWLLQIQPIAPNY